MSSILNFVLKYLVIRIFNNEYPENLSMASSRCTQDHIGDINTYCPISTKSQVLSIRLH